MTLDVTELYTNIPNQLGINAVNRTLQREHTGKTKIGSLVALLKAVLHLNNFTFLGEHYFQIGGPAMGMKVALSYANIFYGESRKEITQRCTRKTLDCTFAI